MSIPDELKIQLEMRDRLNYPQVLQHSLLQLESAYSSENFNLDIVQNLIYGLYKKIPSSWHDDKFTERLKSVFTEVELDNRPEFGGIKISKALCDRLEIPLIKKVKVINYFDLLNTVIDLLDRKNMLVSRKKMEKSTGRNLAEGETPLEDFHEMTLAQIEDLEGQSLDEIADQDLENRDAEDD